MTLADRARLAGRRIHEAAPTAVSSAICGGIAEVLGWPFTVSPGCLIDSNGSRTASFAAVVHTEPSPTSQDNHIPADNALAVIDVVEDLGLEGLRASHARLLVAKRLEKTKAPEIGKTPVATGTIAILFVRKTSVPIDVILENFKQLNEGLPHSEWIDMVAISGVAVIAYACQFAGQSALGGVLPPAKGALKRYSPAWYIIPTMQASGNGTFNRVVSFILSYTVFFSPGVAVPNFNELLLGVEKTLVTSFGYQYNLSGDLAQIPREQYADRLLPRRPVMIEARRTKELLGSLQYVQWQDGGVILSKGKLPLEGLMVFLVKDALQKGGVMRTGPDTQSSYVMPIMEADFVAMVTRLRSQSDMIVRQAEPKFVMEKIVDEGTRVPFMARIFMGLLHIREAAYADEKERLGVDKLLDQALTPLLAARVSAQEIEMLWRTHVGELSVGHQVQIDRGSIQVDGNCYRVLRKEVNSFLYDAAKTLKEGAQKFGKGAGVDIGFMFQKEAGYLSGLRAMQACDPILAAYIQTVRGAWSERLIEARNDLDHGGWVLPRIRYEIREGKVVAQQPQILGMPVVDFVKHMLDRITCFTEDYFAHCFQFRLPRGIALTEIPLVEREAEAPERFRPTLRQGGLPPWRINYSFKSFEDI